MKIGRYEILETIGQGAAGKVVRAFDPLINRVVAVKLFSADLASGDARQRFQQEARVVGQLSHPFIITLHDMGVEDSTSTLYLVMEYVEGQPLDAILAKGSIPYPRACAWAADVASALAAAHRKGVIHGDVKPANILINQENRVKLTDFGMARLQRRDAKDTPLLGTPAYWCPEQIFGKPQDSRSDLYSLGIVLYEMVTGVKPFTGETLQALCGQIISSSPLPPGHNNPSLPAAINTILERCLAKDPEARYADGDLLAADLYPLARRKAKPHMAMVPSPAETTQRRRIRLF